MPKKLTQEEFLAKARAVHGEKYDYSETRYTSTKSNVGVRCLAHGVFWQRANSHIMGSGCPRCPSQVLLTAADLFVAKARVIHGNIYDYSQVEYKKAILKVQIICPQHGVFMQAPNPHLRGAGCPRCGDEQCRSKIIEAAKMNFISKARSVHGTRYSYAQTDYKNAHANVTIICVEHGSFQQSATSHLGGRGCPACARLLVENSRRVTRDSFIEKAQTIHGNKYDYSKTKISRLQPTVAIICPTHGMFHQLRRHHLSGHGCEWCGKEANWFNKGQGRPATLYLIAVYSATELFYKVGITYRGVKRRFEGKNPLIRHGYKYRLLASYTSENNKAIWEWEQSILATFLHLQYRPAIRFEGYSECLSEAVPILEVLPFGTKFYEVDEVT